MIAGMLGRSPCGLRWMKMRPWFVVPLRRRSMPTTVEKSTSTFGSWRDDVGDRRLVPHHGIERDALRGLGEREDRALILVRDEALRDAHEQPDGGDEDQQRGDHHRRGRWRSTQRRLRS